MMLIRLRARDVIVVMVACSSIIALLHFLFRELRNVYDCITLSNHGRTLQINLLGLACT